MRTGPLAEVLWWIPDSVAVSVVRWRLSRRLTAENASHSGKRHPMWPDSSSGTSSWQGASRRRRRRSGGGSGEVAMACARRAEVAVACGIRAENRTNVPPRGGIVPKLPPRAGTVDEPATSSRERAQTCHLAGSHREAAHLCIFRRATCTKLPLRGSDLHESATSRRPTPSRPRDRGTREIARVRRKDEQSQHPRHEGDRREPGHRGDASARDWT